jgi:hypothetical protein
MSRPPPPHRKAPPPLLAGLDDSASFGGLAEVLEPDPDAVTSMHQAARRQVRESAPIQLQDFAFADTVFANELDERADDELAPPSGPIYVNDSMGNTQCITPLAFRLPDAGPAVDFATRLRVLHAHLRHAVRGAYEEMRELWAGTAEMVEGGASGSRFDRVLALWSCFQWSRADVTRAAIIGLAVFVTAAAIGATALDFDAEGTASAKGNAISSTEVRGGHTLDQHTGKKAVVHAKR